MVDELRINPETPCVIITPHGRISINWSSTDRSDNERAERMTALIVRAVNAHDELVRALQTALDYIEDEPIGNAVVPPPGSKPRNTKDLEGMPSLKEVLRGALKKAGA